MQAKTIALGKKNQIAARQRIRRTGTDQDAITRSQKRVHAAPVNLDP